MNKAPPPSPPYFPPPRTSAERALPSAPDGRAPDPTAGPTPGPTLDTTPDRSPAEAPAAESKPVVLATRPEGDGAANGGGPSRAAPSFSKEEIRALLAVSGAAHAPAAPRSRWRNPRTLIVPSGSIVWMVQSYLPLPIGIALIGIWVLLVAAEVRRLVRGMGQW